MKRSLIIIIAICLLSLLSLSVFSGCDISLDKDGGMILSKLTELPAPVLTEVVEDYIYWEEVPNASSYVLKVNNIQEDTGNKLKYSLASILDGRIETNVPTELHIYIKAKGNQILYADSQWSSEFTYTYTKTTASMNTDAPKLAVPSNIKMSDTTLSWDEVPNANGYRIIVEGEDATYTTASCVFDFSSVFNTSRSFNVELQSLSADHTVFSDSDRTAATLFNFVKNEKRVQVGFADLYKSNGLGRTIDLINANSYTPKSGAGYIFNEEALFSRSLLEETIRDQKATYEYGTSFESFYGKWKFDIGLKVANEAFGVEGIYLPYTADFNVEIKGGYEQVRKEETKELYIKMHHNVVGKSVELLGHASDYDYYASILSDNFKNAARKVVDEKTAEQFISVWGTHVIMAAYYGAAFEATYYNISHDKYKEDNWYVDIEAAVKAHLLLNELSAGLDFDLNRDTNSNTKNSLSQFQAYAVGGNGVAFSSDLGSFQKAYETWANGLSESNYTLIDFPEHSLYCIWDYLDDSFAEQKAILNSYFVKQTQNKISTIRAKISGLYNSQSFEYLDESHNVSYQAATKTLIFDFSSYQESGKLSDTGFAYERFEKGVLTVNPVEYGRGIEKVIFRGSYKTRSSEDNHLIDSIIKGLSIRFSDNWTSGVEITFENFGFESLSNAGPLDLSSIPANELVTIRLIGNNSLSDAPPTSRKIFIITITDTTPQSYYGINCASSLKIIGDEDKETYIGGSIYSKGACEIDLKGKLTVVGSVGYTGNKTQSSVDGKAAIRSDGTISISVGTGSHLYGGDGAEPGVPDQVTGRGVTGMVGYNGGNGGPALRGQNIYILTGDLHLHAGNGGKGGQGGAGSKGVSKWDTGTDGGKGGTGGNGGNGGTPIVGLYSIEDPSYKIYLYGGNGGKGGTGGSGGEGGVSDGEGRLVFNFATNRHKGLNGGTGGKGGTGGVSSLRIIQNDYKSSNFVFVNANDLKPGDGGVAGSGGSSGYIYNHSLDFGTYYGKDGGSGSGGDKGEY